MENRTKRQTEKSKKQRYNQKHVIGLALNNSIIALFILITGRKCQRICCGDAML